MPELQFNEIIVTEIEPRLKHPTIFRKFDELSAGQGLVIINDHDPKPLYYQLLGERGNVFTWEYLAEGPECWKVRIIKLVDEGDEGPTVGEIAASDYRKAMAFKRLGIDFCCGGKKSLREAAEKTGVDVKQIEMELKQIDMENRTPGIRFNEWSIDFLTDYIKSNHHTYVKRNLPQLRELVQKVKTRHGDSNPELHAIAERFELLYFELIEHMEKEEKILFPFIKEVAKGFRFSREEFDAMHEPVEQMESEHEVAGMLMAEIRKLTRDYTPPANACNSFTILYHGLEEFENDLHQHIHLENNILFPKVIQLSL